MKKFKFPLEALKRVREIEEKKALADLARVVEKVNEKEAVRQKAEDNYKNEIEAFSTSQKKSFDLEKYQMYDRYLEKLNAEQKYAIEEIEKIRPQLQEHQSIVMEARRQTRVLEILRDRYKEQYDYALRKKEQKELAEINARSIEEPLNPEVRATDRFEQQDSISGDDLKARKQKEVNEYYKQLGMPDSVLNQSYPGE